MLLSAALDKPITTQYFESSVYRNILDMIATLNQINTKLRDEMVVIAWLRGGPVNIYIQQYEEISKVFLYGPGKLAYAYAHSKGFRIKNDWIDWFLFTAKLRGINVSKIPWRNSFDKGPVASMYSSTRVNRAFMNARSFSLDLSSTVRTLQWELNRVHLPMVEGLRNWSNIINNYVYDLPSRIPDLPAIINRDSDIPQVDLASVDRGRIAAVNAAEQLNKFNTWLQTMRQQVIKRDRTDQAALIAIEKQKTAEAKAARLKEQARRAKIAADAAVEKVTINNPAGKVVKTKFGKGALIVTGAVAALLAFL